MAFIKPTEDIQPLSEFRANATAVLKQVQTTRRPVVLTQHGRGTAVLLAIDRYEALVQKLELLRDIHVAETEVAEGKGVSHTRAGARLRGRRT